MDLKSHFTERELKILGEPADLPALSAAVAKLVADLATDKEKVLASEDGAARMLYNRAAQELSKLNAKSDALTNGQSTLQVRTVIDAEVLYSIGAKSVRNMTKNLTRVFNKDLAHGFVIVNDSLRVAISHYVEPIRPKAFVSEQKLMTITISIVFEPKPGQHPVVAKTCANAAYLQFRAETAGQGRDVLGVGLAR